MRSIQIPSSSNSPPKKKNVCKPSYGLELAWGPSKLPFLCATEHINQNIVKPRQKLQYQQDSCVYIIDIMSKSSGESKYERIGRETCFLLFCNKHFSKFPPAGDFGEMPYFSDKNVGRKSVRKGRISMGSRNLGGCEAITMFCNKK